MTAAGWGVVAGAGSAFYTYGLSIFGCIYSGRALYIAIQKFTILKAVWRSRALGDVRIRKRDIIGPLAVGIATLLVGVELGAVLSGGLQLAGQLAIDFVISNSHLIAAAAAACSSGIKRIIEKLTGGKERTHVSLHLGAVRAFHS